ncbi:hypothetical protein [Pseudomonas sp. 1]|uniref:hypothetical protein n=1 Tax=Pseudomonas sp. 1 TaxID=488747 RepID=UPI00209B00F8|nr:hypothetical protein [Pseudomonas sp. 1]MCO7521032.1 hypothetical protein [Pseudomonas sp. 1]
MRWMELSHGSLCLAVKVWLICSLSILDANAMNGAQTAIALNQRVAATPARCLGNEPEDACSGVLMRPMIEAHQREFWRHDSLADRQQYEPFQLLRRDGKTVGNPERSGYVMHAGFDAAAQGKPYQVVGREGNEVRLGYWDASQPKQLPVQAIYYQPGLTDALLRAQRSQMAWFQATGQWLPVLRYVAGDAPFGFDQREQLYNGYEVAKAINARYASQDSVCPDGRSRFFCNGVLVRGTGVGSFKAWNPSPASQRNNSVSFSYFSVDAGLDITIWPQGYIVSPLGGPVTRRLIMSCIYPFDGGTSNLGQPCVDRGICSGITDKTAWLNRYPTPPRNSCAFRPDPAEFDVGVKAHRWSLEEHRRVNEDYDWNEVIVQAWPQDKPGELPLEAFFYSPKVRYPPAEPGPANARRFQREYVTETHRYLPVLRLDPKAPDGKLVTYLPLDQATE